jgi:tetratricopeptide (TPR) repeat protein
MVAVKSFVPYHVAGLPDSTLLSVIEVTATVRSVAFGRIEGKTEPSADPSRTVLRQWWVSQTLGEPSFDADIAVTRTTPKAVQAGLLVADTRLTDAAACVASLQALAERAQLKLPSLDDAVFVGTFGSNGTLSCPSPDTGKIVPALKGIGAQQLIGPFAINDKNLQGITVRPVHELRDLLQVALGEDPEGQMRLMIEWLLLFDSEIQGTEAKLWREAERRAAENLASLGVWFEEIGRRLPQSQVIQAALTALTSLRRFQTGKDKDGKEVEERIRSLEKTKYLLTAIWLLTRWAFLLREQRRRKKADQCLARADATQRQLRLKAPVPILLHQQGRVLYYQAKFAEALQKHWHGYNFVTQSSGREDLLADFYNAAGKCFTDIYQFAMALELFERACDIRQNLKEDDKLAGTYGSIAEVYWRLGDLNQAQRFYSKDLELAQRVDESRQDRREEMRVKNYLANILFAKEEWKRARELYQETETYYRMQYQKGNSQELGNLVYSVEGLARVAAAEGNRDEVQRLVDLNFQRAKEHITANDAARLPVALLAYVNAVRLRHKGKSQEATAWLREAETLLDPLYPAEQATVVIEQLLLHLWTSPLATASEDKQLLRKARILLWKLLNTGKTPAVKAAFAPIRQQLDAGHGALKNAGKKLCKQERERRKDLWMHFFAARRQMATGSWPAAISSLQAIQRFVVFFRDFHKHITDEENV